MGKHLSKRRVNEVVALRRLGVELKEISERTGIKYASVYGIVRRDKLRDMDLVQSERQAESSARIRQLIYALIVILFGMAVIVAVNQWGVGAWN